MSARAEPSPPADLAEVQALLTAVLRRPSPLTEDADLSARCAAFVAGNERVSPAEQVDIYRRQFWMRHEDALREDYPGLIHVIGEDAWDDLLRAYLEAHPPSSPTLRDLGHAMATFVGGYPHLPAGREELARDMTRYERAFVDVFDGADPAPLSPTRLAALRPEDWERARIALSPLVVRMRLAYPVHVLRKAVRGGESPALPAPRDVRLALFRKDLVVCFEELDVEQLDLLEALDGGASLVEACARVAEGKSAEATERLSRDVGGWFRDWASSGFIADVVVP
jgi:hypothetical protein